MNPSAKVAAVAKEYVLLLIGACVILTGLVTTVLSAE